MTDPANRFMFDTSFDAPKSAVDGGEEPPTFDEADIAAARQEGFEAGRQDGLAAAQAQIERHVADALSVIRDGLTELAAERDAALAKMTEGGLAIATAIGRKVAPNFCQRNALGEVEALISDCLTNLSDEPRVAIRVSDGLLDSIRDRLTPIAAEAGFAGSITLLNDPEMDCSDCRVEWAEGGADRAVAHLLEDIDAAIARTLTLPSLDADATAEVETEDSDSMTAMPAADGPVAEIGEPDTASDEPAQPAPQPDPADPASEDPPNIDENAPDDAVAQVDGNGDATDSED